MSDELTGRARGRARGRLRLQQSDSDDPRHSQPPSSSQLHQQQHQQQPQRPAPQRALGSSGRSMPGRPAADPVRQVTQQMGAASISERGGAQGDVAPSRGGVRTRRFDVPEVVTKPASLSSKQGAGGDKVRLRSNYFKLITHTEWALYQYRVDFAPDEDRIAIRKGLLRVHKDALGPYLFDGTVLYAITKLNPDPLELYSSRTSDEAKVRITIKKTSDLAMGDPSYIQFFNILLRKCIAGLNLQLVGRDFYDAAAKVCVDKHNLELWPGFVTSIRQHESDILLGVDLANKIMRRDTAMNLIMDFSQRSPGRWKELFEQAIVGATVITPYNNQTYRVDDIDFESTPLSTFLKGNGERVTYMDYYKQKYGVNISNRSQPMLISRPKLKDVRGGRTNNAYLVPELCCLTGLSDEMRNNFSLMRDLEEHTRLQPAARAKKVVDFIRRLTTNPLAKEELSLWNVKFAPDLVEFAGRILAPEKIVLGGGELVEGNREADWTRSLRGHAMYRSTELSNWSVIYLRRSQRDVENFIRTLINASSSLQFRIPQPHYEDIPDDRPGTYVQAIEKVVARGGCQLVMCIVPFNRADKYDAIKKKCCVDRAIPSQVVVAKNITSKGVMSIATKIAIQMNCKIGGSPWSLNVPFKKPVMVVGFDVCHDSSIKERSYGAMVASLDGAYSKYFSTVSAHKSGEELSNDISIQVLKAVIIYRRDHGFLPPKIIIYRDGVGEGRESYVLSHEVDEIRKKLEELYQSEPVRMAFVIVSKRINTRLFLNGGNPPPGTIADDCITSPIKYDFFLVSQSVRQGTVAPTSYNVIYDTSQITPEIMQKLAFKMTHLYFNWSGTVRVPAPVQYAHKLAFLCGQHLHKQPNEMLNELLHFL